MELAQLQVRVNPLHLQLEPLILNFALAEVGDLLLERAKPCVVCTAIFVWYGGKVFRRGDHETIKKGLDAPPLHAFQRGLI